MKLFPKMPYSICTGVPAHIFLCSSKCKSRYGNKSWPSTYFFVEVAGSVTGTKVRQSEPLLFTRLSLALVKRLFKDNPVQICLSSSQTHFIKKLGDTRVGLILLSKVMFQTVIGSVRWIYKWGKDFISVC